MPTMIRRANAPAARVHASAERARREAHRLQGAELFAQGVRPAEVARRLGVSKQSAGRWHGAWQHGGAAAVRSKGPSGASPGCRSPTSSSSPQRSARAPAPTGSPARCGRCGASRRWSNGRRGALPRRAPVGDPAPADGLERTAAGPPRPRARRGRDPAVGCCGVAADQGKRPPPQSPNRLLRRVRGEPAAQRPPHLGASRPSAGAAAPVQLEAGLDGGRAVLRGRRRLSLFFHVHPGSYDTVSLIEALKQLRVFLGGQKATVLWDGLPAHRSTAMAAFVASQRDWLTVERLPGYAPELNPAEQLWANLKGNELANLACEGWVESSARPGRGSRGSVGPGTCRTRSCATPACRSPERQARPRPAAG
jgi:transposase-like protein